MRDNVIGIGVTLLILAVICAVFSSAITQENHSRHVKCEQAFLPATSRPDSLRIAIDRHCEEFVR